MLNNYLHRGAEIINAQNQMRKLQTLLLTLIAALIFSCNNTDSSKTNSSVDYKTPQEKRAAYVKQKGWLTPEQMELVAQGLTPIEERGFMDETQRKQAFIDKLTAQHVADTTIQQLVVELEQIIGGRSGQWNYEYIQARLANYQSEMAQDEEWKKIEAACR